MFKVGDTVIRIEGNGRIKTGQIAQIKSINNGGYLKFAESSYNYNPKQFKKVSTAKEKSAKTPAKSEIELLDRIQANFKEW